MGQRQFRAKRRIQDRHQRFVRNLDPCRRRWSVILNDFQQASQFRRGAGNESLGLGVVRKAGAGQRRGELGDALLDGVDRQIAIRLEHVEPPPFPVEFAVQTVQPGAELVERIDLAWPIALDHRQQRPCVGDRLLSPIEVFDLRLFRAEFLQAILGVIGVAIRERLAGFKNGNAVAVVFRLRQRRAPELFQESVPLGFGQCRIVAQANAADGRLQRAQRREEAVAIRIGAGGIFRQKLVVLLGRLGKVQFLERGLGLLRENLFVPRAVVKNLERAESDQHHNADDQSREHERPDVPLRLRHAEIERGRGRCVHHRNARRRFAAPIGLPRPVLINRIRLERQRHRLRNRLGRQRDPRRQRRQQHGLLRQRHRFALQDRRGHHRIGFDPLVRHFLRRRFVRQQRRELFLGRRHRENIFALGAAHGFAEHVWLQVKLRFAVRADDIHGHGNTPATMATLPF